MNKRLKQLLESTQMGGVKQTCLLDTYNQTIHTDIAPTISTRVDASSNTYIMEVIPLNPYNDGTARTIKAQYQQSSMANFKRQDGLGATGVLCIPQATRQGYIEVEQGGVFDAAYPESTTRRGRVQEGGKVTPTICTSNELCVYEGIEQKGFLNEGKHQQDYIQGVNGVSRAVCAGSHASTPHLLKTQLPDYRIRKLTPRECFRLMGVTDENVDKIQIAGISNAQQYKMAGNSIVVDTLYHIFKKMFIEKENDNEQLTLF